MAADHTLERPRSEQIGARDGSTDDRIPLSVVVDRALPWVAGALAFGVYLATLAPTISILDSPELSAAAITLGVPHPTGYPLFTLVGHGFTIVLGTLTGGDPAWRLNLLTACFAALAVGGIAAVSRKLGGRASGGWLAAGVFAFSPGFWAQATVVEVYALHVAFSVLILWSWLRLEEAADNHEDPRRALFVLAFVTGLSFTHHLMTVLVLPVVGPAVIRTLRSQATARDAVTLGLPALALALAPLSLYAALPIIAASDPLVNWGNPQSLEALWFHVSGAQYHHNLGAAEAGILATVREVPAQLAREMGFLLLPLAGLGAWKAGGAPRKSGALALGFAVALAFGLSYGVVDSEPFTLNAHLIVALWIGCGAVVVHDFIDARAPLAARAYEGLVWLAPALALLSGFAAQDRHLEYGPHDHTIAAFDSLPENAVLITQGPAGYPPVYAQLVERLRPDVAVVDMYLNVRGSYGPELDRLRQSRLPDGVTREMALAHTVAALDGGTRSLWLMPGVPDNSWNELGLHRLRGGILDALVRSRPDLRSAAPESPPVATFSDGPNLLALRLSSHEVEAGAAVEVETIWRLTESAGDAEAPTVTLVLADASGEAPTGPDDMPLLEQKRPLGMGTSLEHYAATGDVIRESLSLLVPRSIEPGPWWLWVAVRSGETWFELPDGRLFARTAAIEVTPRVRPLWTLRAH